MDQNKFSMFAVSPSMLQTIAGLGYETCTPIQSQSLPHLLNGKDLLGQAETGSGKTAAFLIPIIEKIDPSNLGTQALILCPTRELGDQVLRECRKFIKAKPSTTVVGLFGGQPMLPQIKTLQQGANIVVGTPGRVLDHLHQNNIYAQDISTLVLDEADRLLDQGFAEEIDSIISYIPARRQTVFFSATFPEEIQKLSARYQRDAIHVKVESVKKDQPSISHYKLSTENAQKFKSLVSVLSSEKSRSTIIFCRTKNTVKELGENLKKLGVSCCTLHGDLEQPDRDLAMYFFRSHAVRVLVATDVAARGLDVEDLQLVVNYDMPPNAETFVHRVGRTGRAGRSGRSISFVTDYENPFAEEIENLLGQKFINIESEVGDSELSQIYGVSETQVLMIAGGKKDKLRPADIVGALTAQPRPLDKSEIGVILIQDRASFVAIERPKFSDALNKLKNGKVKARTFKVYEESL